MLLDKYIYIERGAVALLRQKGLKGKGRTIIKGIFKRPDS